MITHRNRATDREYDLSDLSMRSEGSDSKRTRGFTLTHVAMASFAVAAVLVLVGGYVLFFKPQGWLTFLGAGPARNGTAGSLGPVFLTQADEIARLASSKKNNRFLTAMQTDKPWYRPGETLWVRVVAVNPFLYAQIPVQDSIPARLMLVGPSGALIIQSRVALDSGAMLGSLKLASDLAGGTYTLRLLAEDGRLVSSERNVTLLNYRPSQMKLELLLGSEGQPAGAAGPLAGYGPGDRVDARLTARTAEGEPMAGALLEIVARVDGIEVHRSQGSISFPGTSAVPISLTLPPSIAGGRGDGALSITVSHAGRVETVTRTLPLALQSEIDVAFFPAGGHIVEGLPSEVYFEARSPVSGEPLALSGVLCSNDNKCGTDLIETVHEGRGKFTMVAQAGVRYHLQLSQPRGALARLPDRLIVPAGVSLILDPRDANSRGPIQGTIRVRANPPTGSVPVRIVLSQHEQPLAVVHMELSMAVQLTGASAQRFSLALPAGYAGSGMLRVTVLDGADNGLAERLCFLAPSDSIKLTVEPSCDPCAPRDNVTLRVTAQYVSSGKPVVGALLAVSVVDDAVLARAEPRRRAPGLAEALLLESAIGGPLFDAQAYLGNAQALDLLLGTQGWRRFAWLAPISFADSAAPHGRGALWASRALALNVPPVQAERSEHVFMAGAEPKKLARGAPELAAAAMPMMLEADGAVSMADASEAAFPLVDENDDRMGRLVAEAIPAPGWGEQKPNRDISAPSLVRVLTGLRREYAHAAAPLAADGVRRDFAETVYFGLIARTDATGTSTVRFTLSEAVTSFAAQAEILAKHEYQAGGVFGRATRVFASSLPLAVQAKLPAALVSGDMLSVPIVVSLGGALASAESVAIEAVDLTGPLELALDAAHWRTARISIRNGGGRLLLPVRVAGVANVSGGVPASLAVTVRAGPHSDRSAAQTLVYGSGFPIASSTGALVQPDSYADLTLVVPSASEPGTLALELLAHPSPQSSLQKALESLLHEPTGCFEQTSATTYPLVMALQYMDSHAGVDRAMRDRAAALLGRGYERLVSYEVRDGGFEWFGGSPAHEALSAYGLAQFTDMARVFPVDASLLERTQRWLLTRVNSETRMFERSPQALDSFGRAPDETTNAYILWSLVGAGVTEPVSALIADLKAAAELSTDSYVIALAAGVCFRTGDTSCGVRLGRRLIAFQDASGYVSRSLTSITSSSGRWLDVETTALAVLAWLADDASFAANTEQAMRWLASVCADGLYGSTQGTVLALKAIVAYDNARASERRDGTLRVTLTGSTGTLTLPPVPLAGSAEAPIALAASASLAAKLAPGTYSVRIVLERGFALSVSAAVRYRTRVPERAADAASVLDFATTLRPSKLREGESCEIEVSVRNRNATKGLPMVVAVVGVPGGLAVRSAKLDQLVASGAVDYYELRDGEVHLYWRSMAPGARANVRLDAVAEAPGTYAGRASRARQYYFVESTEWLAGLPVVITSEV